MDPNQLRVPILCLLSPPIASEVSTFLDDSCRPYAENPGTVFFIMVDLTASDALEKRKQISSSKLSLDPLTAMTQVTQLRHFPIFVKV